uniref:Uncharacterized protein n=1 Tax=Rhizophora mucronata TaxID=61149 RepID=A0A2P2P0J9_RHIMU
MLRPRIKKHWSPSALHPST